MPVALDIANPQGCHHFKIIEQRHRPDISEIFTTHQPSFLRALATIPFNETAIGQPFENSFAILVARPAIAQLQSTAQRC